MREYIYGSANTISRTGVAIVGNEYRVHFGVSTPSTSEFTGIIMVSMPGYQVRGGVAFNFAALLSFAVGERERKREAVRN